MNHRVFLAGSLFVALAVGSTASGQHLSFDKVKDKTDTMVLLRAQRMYMGRELITGGTGFFVHSDGWIMTDLHAVDERFDAPKWMGGTEIFANPFTITALVRDGEEVRHLEAEVVFTDRKRSLALLKVHTTHAHAIDPIADTAPRKTGPVFYLGFPWAGLNEESVTTSESDPQLTLIDGKLTGDARDAEGLVASHSVLDAGHCGALAFDSTGALIGVTICQIKQNERAGYVLPMAHASNFFLRSMITTSFDPGVVLKPPQPIKITVGSRTELDQLAGWTSEAKIVDSGRNVLATIPLERNEGDNSWTGTLDPTTLSVDPGTRRISPVIYLKDPEKRLRYSRAWGIDIVPGALAKQQ